MKHFSLTHKNSVFIWLLVYLMPAIILMPHFFYELSPDAISLYHIAEAFLRGDWHDAVNAYWGPVNAWVLLPWMSMGFSAILSARIVQIIAGLCIVWVSHLILQKQFSNQWSVAASMLSVITYVLWFSLSGYTSDLLFLIPLLVFLYYRMQCNNVSHVHPLKLAMIGFWLFLTRSFGFPLFLALTTFFFIQSRSVFKRALIKYLSTIGFFFLFLLLWSGVLYLKYGFFTIGTAPKYNYSLVRPDVVPLAHPFRSQGLFEPSGDHSTSVWDDVSMLEVKHWNPFESESSFQHQLNLITGNTLLTVVYLKHFSLLAPLFLFFTLYFLMRRHDKERPFFVFLIVSGVLMAGGYILVFVEVRYLWFFAFLFSFLLAKIVDVVFHAFRFGKPLAVGVIMIAIALIIRPAYYQLIAERESGRLIHSYVEKIKGSLTKSKVASVGHFDQSLMLSYLSRAKYYGDIKPLSKDEAQQQLKEFGIEHLLVWVAPDEQQPHIGNFSVMKQISSDLFVYKHDALSEN